MFYQSIKLTNHQEYLKLLNSLKSQIKYVEILLNDESDLRIIEKFKDNIISTKEVTSWWNFHNQEVYSTKLIRLTMDEKLYNYLENFDTLAYIFEPRVENTANFSEFGKNDIAFLNEHERVILRTNIKYGYIDIEYKKEENLCN